MTITDTPEPFTFTDLTGIVTAYRVAASALRQTTTPEDVRVAWYGAVMAMERELEARGHRTLAVHLGQERTAGNHAADAARTAASYAKVVDNHVATYEPED